MLFFVFYIKTGGNGAKTINNSAQTYKKAEEKVDKSRNFKYNISRLAEANSEKCLNNGVHYDVT